MLPADSEPIAGPGAQHRQVAAVPRLHLVDEIRTFASERSGQWWSYAACLGQTSLFFPPGPQVNDVALAICRDCPVIAQCRHHVVTMVQQPTGGVWAGMGISDVLHARRAYRLALAKME